MIRDTFENIVKNQDVRQNLSKLRQELKEGMNRHALLYAMGEQDMIFVQLLEHEDAKTRKNAALVMGAIGKNEYLPYLYEAYQKEEQLFVKSAYLTAISEFDYRDYMDAFKERMKELHALEITEENKKHITEELRALSNLVVRMEGVATHEFVGYHVLSDLVLLTNRNHMDVTIEDLQGMRTKAFGAGVMVRTDQLEEVLKVRTYQELLFVVDGMRVCPREVEDAAKTIVKSDLFEFLVKRHKGKAPFYFRIELKAKMELDKKSAYTKKLAAEIERLSNRNFINTTSNYEFEIRMIENREGSFNVLVKLYTLPDERFAYRKEVIPTSIRPMNAALTVALTKHHMKENAQVLDPFCGVGTMLIERHKAVKANTTYGLDIYGEAIEKARNNTYEAHQIIHYINRDFFDFTHDYLFDEIITNMPAVIGRKQESEIYEVYEKFFKKAKVHMKEDGCIILYSHNKEYVKKFASKYGYRIVEEYEISMREGSYVFVIKW